MSEPKSALITERSGVTIGLLVIIIGGVAWLTNVAAMSQATSIQLGELKGYIYNELRAIRQDLKEIRDRLPSKP